jgi:hypothetical protein
MRMVARGRMWPRPSARSLVVAGIQCNAETLAYASRMRTINRRRTEQRPRAKNTWNDLNKTETVSILRARKMLRMQPDLDQTDRRLYCFPTTPTRQLSVKSSVTRGWNNQKLVARLEPEHLHEPRDIAGRKQQAVVINQTCAFTTFASASYRSMYGSNTAASLRPRP